MNATDNNNSEFLKGRIISYLLENEVANTGAIADYCGFSDKITKYRDVARPLKELIDEDWVEEIGNYRPDGSRWRYGTGYKLVHAGITLCTIYSDLHYEKIRHRFHESTWLREFIIDTQILPGVVKNKVLLHSMLQISPTFLKICLLNELTHKTLQAWETPVSNISWLYRGLSEKYPLDTISQDYQFLEILRFCLLQDWAETYSDGNIPKEFQELLHDIKIREERELGRILDTVLACRTVESINYFTSFNETQDDETKTSLHNLVLNYMENQYNLPKAEGKDLTIMLTETQNMAHAISETIGLMESRGTEDALTPTSAFMEKYLKKEKSSSS